MDIEKIADSTVIQPNVKATQNDNNSFMITDLDTVVACGLDFSQARAYLQGTAWAWANCTGESIRIGIYSKTGILLDTVEHLFDPSVL